MTGFPVAATCYVLGIANLTLIQTSIFTQYALLRIVPHLSSHAFPDNQSRQILTAEGLYNSTPMIGSDCGGQTRASHRCHRLQAGHQRFKSRSTTVTTPNGPTVQRAEMLPGTPSSLLKIDPILSEGFSPPASNPLPSTT
ncbi:uncharacterized protein LACBIDRAFT_316657 [Laccaria bicolor S238N-H82]|uniref:Predicted protein n=1 Tax=Laccaria bicolor (strain S238N-H82 / ATCC MYA-4686) TaxID=486041 RepID=B0E1D0_LACBS|nr:uncharacterized protein LACBIDRAFT_316657 [Laccaria bicolor S238N-H82]EDQ99359.1 predicted protein [Laccaria bicolor S238N-H82]|eukprot:XP_001890005.1 predicted protein [Laccaria bicolor S238N-H82]